jgi:hypothetical protein
MDLICFYKIENIGMFVFQTDFKGFRLNGPFQQWTPVS